MTRAPLRALFLPPLAWSPEFREFVPGGAPDPNEVYEVLRENGIESEIIDPNKWPWNPFSGKNTLYDGLDITRAVRVLVARRKIDIVVCVFESPAVPLVLLRGLANFRKPIVLWDVGLTESWKIRKRILDLTLPRLEGIMVLSSNQKSYIEKRWRTKRPVDVIFHHIDANFFHPAPDEPNGYLLSVGKDHGRDFETMLAAARDLPIPIAIKTTKQIADRLGRDPRIAWHLTYQSYAGLRDLYAAARFVVIPLRETLNASGVSTILEAYAMGKAVIVSDTEAMRDYFVPDETCLAVPSGDSNALREAIMRLSSDTALRTRLAQGGRQLVEARFADRPFAQGLAKALYSYVGGPVNGLGNG